MPVPVGLPISAPLGYRYGCPDIVSRTLMD
jgi:hypothetical protein